MHAVNDVTVDEISIKQRESASLLDCYRIAIDFGMPAALKAYEKLNQEPMLNNESSS